ncbi:MAG: hypothetical protein GY786_17460 [Proteobacteria bacterium]|nr:hypothetical protein [Pseudomonadota bacterium]
MLSYINNRYIAYKLMISILLCSSIITLIGTGLQLYLDYKKDVDQVKTRLEEIHDSYAQSLSNSLWLTEIDQTRIMMEGILKLPAIVHLVIRNDNKRVVEVGYPQGKNIIQKDFALSFSYRKKSFKLGDLSVTASLEGIYNRLKDRILIILITQGVKTFLVSLFIFSIVQWLFTRHLTRIANYTSNFDLNNTEKPLMISRKKQLDELNAVVHGINRMRTHLHESYQDLSLQLEQKKKAENELNRYKDELENQVHERTIELKSRNQQLREEIKQRIEIENRLTRSLEEKEVLMQEIHHRVKNNMQIVSSLLELQLEYGQKADVVEMTKNSQRRIYAMSTIHERLYQTTDMVSINFHEFIQDLAEELLLSYGMELQHINLEIEAEDVLLNVNQAIPCGLIINELISNAIKHAFPEITGAKITVGFKPDSNSGFQLIVKDNGIGMKEVVDMDKPNSMGLKIVSILTRQLKGSINVDVHSGTEFVIQIPKTG